VLREWVGQAYDRYIHEPLLEPIRHCLDLRFGRTSRGVFGLRIGVEGAICELAQTRQSLKLASPEEGRKRLTAWLTQSFGQAKPRVRVELDPELVMIRNVRLPLAAKKNIKQVLGYEMDRLSPFESDAVYYHFTPIPSEEFKDWIEGRLVVVQKANADPWYALLNQMGIALDAVVLRGESQPLTLKPVKGRDLRGTWPDWALWLGMIILALVYSGSAIWQERRIAIDLDQIMHQARAEAGKARQLQEQVDARKKAVDKVTQERQAYVPQVDILLDLTRLIPAGSWVRSLTLSAGSVSISGESEQASDLISILESSALFEGVRFKSPVVRNRQSGKEMFEIIMNVSREQKP
jgi:general secretion pathway protein L